MTVLGLVPARAGSRRIPAKNVRPLGGHPLIAYSIETALLSGVFDRVVVSTESEEIAEIARHYGADVPFLRPGAYAADLSPDIDWVRFTIETLASQGQTYEYFAILRPTSPLRTVDAIKLAFSRLAEDQAVDSVRAVERCRQHPGKMWVLDDDGSRMHPLLDDGGASPPWHSTPYQALPPVYVQNASLEIARVRVIDATGTIAGRVVRPLVCTGYEGFDLNDPEDWWVLERLVADGAVSLPLVERTPYRPRTARSTTPTTGQE